MPAIPLIPTNSHTCPLDPDLRIVSIERNGAVVVSVLEHCGDFLVTATYSGQRCQSWAVPHPIRDPDLANEYASVLLRDPRPH
jgi:hypothetical protein